MCGIGNKYLGKKKLNKYFGLKRQTMKYTTFTTEIQEESKVIIPPEVRERLELKAGDKLEVTLKKIKSRRLEILISENPLYKLIKFAEK